MYSIDIFSCSVTSRHDVVPQFGWTALFYAAKMGYQSICRALVEGGTDVNLRDVTGRTALTVAAEHGEVPICDSLVKTGVDPTKVDPKGQTA